MRTKRRILWALIGLTIGAFVWAFHVEATYERNVHRGIRTDFQIRNPRAAANWRS